MIRLTLRVNNMAKVQTGREASPFSDCRPDRPPDSIIHTSILTAYAAESVDHVSIFGLRPNLNNWGDASVFCADRVGKLTLWGTHKQDRSVTLICSNWSDPTYSLPVQPMVMRQMNRQLLDIKLDLSYILKDAF